MLFLVGTCFSLSAVTTMPNQIYTFPWMYSLWCWRTACWRWKRPHGETCLCGDLSQSRDDNEGLWSFETVGWRTWRNSKHEELQMVQRNIRMLVFGSEVGCENLQKCISPLLESGERLVDPKTQTDGIRKCFTPDFWMSIHKSETVRELWMCHRTVHTLEMCM